MTFTDEEMFSRTGRRTDSGAWSATSPEGMVATAHYLATAAGARMLAQGGDAADAAVAASLALGVCEPAGSGLGGMAMAVVHRASENRTIALAGACRAPALATPEEILSAGRYRGYRAIAVPGNPAVLEILHGRFGRLPRPDVCAPAIRLATDGFRASPLFPSLLKRYRRNLKAHSAGRLFLDESGAPLAEGTVIRQPVLAKTLDRLATVGFRDFYEGDIARRIVADMERNGGFIREDDLRNLTVLESSPIATSFGDLQVHTCGPPAGGIALIEMLNLWDAAGGGDTDLDSPEGALLLARVIRRARRDRRRLRLKIHADSPGAAAELLDPAYATQAATRIRQEAFGAGETSHISVVDRWGNIVSMTQSIERSFGSADIGPDLGFLYNGFLRAYKVKNRRHPHYLRPAAMARSNSCPTVLMKDGSAWGAVGNTGSERLASGILQVLIRLRRQTPFEAVHAPRLHCTPDDVVMLEEERFSEELRAAIARRGYRIEALPGYAFQVGGLNLVARLPEGFCGVSDPRRDGAAAGPLRHES